MWLKISFKDCNYHLSFQTHSNAPIKSKLQHSPLPWANPGHLTMCPGSWEFDLCLGGVGKIEPEVSSFK